MRWRMTAYCLTPWSSCSRPSPRPHPASEQIATSMLRTAGPESRPTTCSRLNAPPSDPLTVAPVASDGAHGHRLRVIVGDVLGLERLVSRVLFRTSAMSVAPRRGNSSEPDAPRTPRIPARGPRTAAIWMCARPGTQRTQMRGSPCPRPLRPGRLRPAAGSWGSQPPSLHPGQGVPMYRRLGQIAAVIGATTVLVIGVDAVAAATTGSALISGR